MNFLSLLQHDIQSALRRSQKPVDVHERAWEYRDSPLVKKSLYEALRRSYDEVSSKEL